MTHYVPTHFITVGNMRIQLQSEALSIACIHELKYTVSFFYSTTVSFCTLTNLTIPINNNNEHLNAMDNSYTKLL